MNKGQTRWDAARGRWRVRAIRGGRWFRERGQRGMAFLPHFFTLLNLACGLYSMILTVRGAYAQAALLIGAALLADGLDGRLARWARVSGDFGKELDSLADIVSFGAAPALLAFTVSLFAWGPYGLAIAAVFPVCGALRLARFNLMHTSGFFLGLPITAAGTLLAAMVYYYLETPFISTVLLPGAMMILAYLMVSNIPYPDFKKARRGDSGLGRFLLPLVVAVVALVREPSSVIVVPLMTYAALGPYLFVFEKALRKVHEVGATPGQ